MAANTNVQEIVASGKRDQHSWGWIPQILQFIVSLSKSGGLGLEAAPTTTRKNVSWASIFACSHTNSSFPSLPSTHPMITVQMALPKEVSLKDPNLGQISLF